MRTHLAPSRFSLPLGKLCLLVGFWGLSAVFSASPAQAVCDQASYPDWQCLPVQPYMIGDPVAPVPTQADGTPLSGTGICGAFKQTLQSNARVVFPSRTGAWPQDAEDFPVAMNRFMDMSGADVISGARIDETLRTPFDLTNDYNKAGDDAVGDFSTAGCFMSNFGCPFPGSQGGNVVSSFGTRFRGFFRVYPGQELLPIHFGFFADNAVAVTIYSVPKPPAKPRPLQEDLLVSHGLDFNPKIRITQSITFPKPGLYPIEIVHAHFDASAILEFTVLDQAPGWKDLDQLNNLMSGSQSPLSKIVSGLGPDDDRPAFFSIGPAGPETTPENFFQSPSGAPPYTDLRMCRQCPRTYADVTTQTSNATGCDPGYYCNAAAVCSPCIGDQFCGKSCQPCGGGTPYCIPSPVDPMDSTCVQCRDSHDCSVGQLCVQHVCTTPDLCCPATPYLVAPDPTRPTLKVCSICRDSNDCPNGQKCDLVNQRCVDTIPRCNTDGNCGKNDCFDCKLVDPKRPYCLLGQVCAECHYDYQCGDGKYCSSGSCKPCTDDRHCGPTCKSCGRELLLGMDGMTPIAQVTETPFCSHPDETVTNARCVRCTQDSQCGDGNHCDTTRHECVNGCPDKCADGKLCNGSRCVDCYADSQCPCGQCDLETGSCTDICATNADCTGGQCCSPGSDGLRKCQPGRCAGTAGGALCGCSVAAVAPVIVDNDTMDSDGSGLGRSRGVLAALLASLLCLGLVRRKAMKFVKSAP